MFFPPPANKDIYDTVEREGANLSSQQIRDIRCSSHPPSQQRYLRYGRTGGCRPLVSTDLRYQMFPSSPPANKDLYDTRERKGADLSSRRIEISDVLLQLPANKDLYGMEEQKGVDLSSQWILQTHQKHIVNKCKMIRNSAVHPSR